MKEIVIQLADEIAEFFANDAKAKGLSSAELIKYILGMYAQRGSHICTHSLAAGSTAVQGVGILPSNRPLAQLLKELVSGTSVVNKDILKYEARAGALSCKECTMKLTEHDIDEGTCGSCGGSLNMALGRPEENQ